MQITSYDAKLSRDGDNVTVSVTVTNTGSRPGKEIVQLYASDAMAKERNKPEKELRGFAKTVELAPSKSEVIKINFDINDLASFDDAKSAWRLDAGTYNLLIGASSRDTRATLPLEVEEKVTTVPNILAPKVEINTLKR